MAAVELLTNGAARLSMMLALAHGAGGPMDSPFMARIATEIAAIDGLRVVRFEFPYMEARRRGGRRRPPDPEPVLRGR